MSAEHRARPHPDNREIEALRRLIQRAKRLVVLTGAGISTESGIPDFRGPGGLWTRVRPITYDEFKNSEAARLEDWRRRFMMNERFARAAPNAGHIGLAQLAARGRLQALITQNIDGLHRRAGFPPELLIEIHGNSTHGRCIACRTPMMLAQVRAIIDATGTSPRCGCGAPVKAAIISFGERLPETTLRAAMEHARQADAYLVIGSSLQVRPAASLPQIAMASGASLAIINNESTPLDGDADLVIRGGIGAVFGALFSQPV